MRNGKYIIDSIESGLVKLLFSEDETLEEVLNIDHFESFRMDIYFLSLKI